MSHLMTLAGSSHAFSSGKACPRVTMHVNHLKFRDTKSVMTQLMGEASALRHADKKNSAGGNSGTDPSSSPPTPSSSQLGDRVLRNVSFTAPPGQLTYVLSDSREERRALVELVSQSCGQPGVFGGEVFLTETRPGLEGVAAANNAPFEFVRDVRSIAFVSEASYELYTPGLTYAEMLTYQARLRLSHRADNSSAAQSTKPPGFETSVTGQAGGGSDEKVNVQQQVETVLQLMGLLWCKDKLIASTPSTRGAQGGEARKLAVALNLVHLPPVIVMDDPTAGLDAASAIDLMCCVRRLCEADHTVVCALPKPNIVLFELADRVALMAAGYSIYDGPRDQIQAYITSNVLDFVLQANVDLVDFIFDVADGTERPMGSRESIEPDDLQRRFEESEFCTPVLSMRALLTSARAAGNSSNGNEAVPEVVELPSHVTPVLPRSSRGRQQAAGKWRHSLTNFTTTRTYLVIARAFYVKFREREVLAQQLKTSLVLGLFLGYFLWQLGMKKDFLLDLIGSPYNEIAALSANIWLLIAVLFGQQVVNVHIICQKIKLFRHEKRANVCPTSAFWFATLCSEIPFSLASSLVTASLVYFMAELNVGFDEYVFFVGVVSCVAAVGITTATWLAAAFRREMIVRDLFLLMSFLMTISNGYLFHYDQSADYIEHISRINYMRWAFAALMVWKYEDYPDGEAYLTTYDFEHFDKRDFWRIAAAFILFNICAFYLGLSGVGRFIGRFVASGCQNTTRHSVVDKYGNDCRDFGFSSSHIPEDSILSTISKSLVGSYDHSGNDSGKSNSLRSGAFPESTLSQSLLGDSTQSQPTRSRHRLYSGIEEEDDENRPRASSDFTKQDMSFIRTNSSLAPKIFARETSVSSQTGFKTHSSYSRGFSSAGNSGSAGFIEEDETKGPTVTFKDVALTVADPRSPVGYKTVLHPMTGRFEWGRLNVILGAAASGKSSLLAILAGQVADQPYNKQFKDLTSGRPTSIATGGASSLGSPNDRKASGTGSVGSGLFEEVEVGMRGAVWYNQKPLRTDYFQREAKLGEVSRKPWERCGFVECVDLFHMDLTVQDVVTYAMKLRLEDTSMNNATINQNVHQVMELVQLLEEKDIKTKHLNRGCQRRLSIAEEVVHGPTLVLIDEPLTALSSVEAAIITGVLRELVNQDRNVIATMHQPPASVFSVVDSLALLSQGHVIFMGMAEKAVNFFLKSPKLELHQQSLAGIDTCAVDFLIDIACGVVRNDNNERLDTLALADNYKKSSLFAAFKSSTRNLDPLDDEQRSAATNNSKSTATSEKEISRLLTAGSSSIEGVSMEARSLNSEKSIASATSTGGGSNTDSKSSQQQQGFTSKYMATPTSEASTVVSPYRPNSASRFNSAAYMTESEDRESVGMTTSVDVDNSATALQDLCGYCAKAGDCVYYSFLMVATVGKELTSLCHSMTQVDVLLVMYKARVLWERNFRMFFSRRGMIAQSTITIMLLASSLAFILGPSSDDYLSVIGMLGLGNLCIILTNMQYIRFLFVNNQVFLKEHSRGLYTTGLNWMTGDTALLLLRSVHAVLYAVILHYVVELRGKDYFGFFCLCMWMMFMGATQITLTVVHLVPDIRGAYKLVPPIAFLLFYSSGLIVRPSVLPGWTQPWLPSVSPIRWFTQGLTINEYDGNTDAFPVTPVFNSYTYALSLFGWGGKTKWYCFYMLLVCLGVFRVVMIVASVYQTTRQRGQRHRIKDGLASL